MRDAASFLPGDVAPGLRKNLLSSARSLEKMCRNHQTPFIPPSRPEKRQEELRKLFVQFNKDRFDIWTSIGAAEEDVRPHWSGFQNGPHINDLDALFLPCMPYRAVPASSLDYVTKPTLTAMDFPAVSRRNVFEVRMVRFFIVLSILHRWCGDIHDSRFKFISRSAFSRNKNVRSAEPFQRHVALF